MDRRIIDTKLTRLFSSTKDDDRTKIGRSGVGFVSVFALQPCAGEHWRVGFRPDRTFPRVARRELVDEDPDAVLRLHVSRAVRRISSRIDDARLPPLLEPLRDRLRQAAAPASRAAAAGSPRGPT
ncbi:hypothetical protein SAMN02745121_00356 [Nannocystis exedens]|uniref:Uncharacterized protein n=1 Tax=Nannocystis exedens TaxID=54 RepID=A0A1I1SXS4_9BACT|nr:hypothetical protein [Nannocystis exedens]PCC66914.1 hypothetical protein NAEX_09512 [Nannocystis exedens]SFD51244.1 hypothetical protein SAMN02745121_00356 [Nannocystis exedens]